MCDLTGREWVSAFVHFEGPGIYGEACDRVLLEVVRPFVANCRRHGWIDRYFFVRYSDAGPHVRLRMLGDRSAIHNIAVPALERRLIRVQAGACGDRLGLGLSPGVYEPEYDRYGGAAGVAVAEGLFEASSDVVLRILPFVTGPVRSRRLGQGLLLMLVAVHSFRRTRGAAAQFLAWFGRSYLRTLVQEEARQEQVWDMFGGSFERQELELLPYVHMAWEHLSANRPPSRRTASFYRYVARVPEALMAEARKGKLTSGRVGPPLAADAAALALLSSYMHMTSNRLGITLAEESFLSYLTARALRPPTTGGDDDGAADALALAALRAR